MPTTKRGTARK